MDWKWRDSVGNEIQAESKYCPLFVEIKEKIDING
jgi:hypothetical protein